MPTTEKIEKVAQLAASMTEAKAIYLADFTGIDVAAITDLRRKLREASIDYEVVKNRLAKLAAEAAGLESAGYPAPQRIFQKTLQTGCPLNSVHRHLLSGLLEY